MQKSPVSLDSHDKAAAGGAEVAMYLVFGDDEFSVATKAKELVDGMVPPEDRALGLEVIDGRAEKIDQAVTAVRRCVEALQTVGFLGAGKVVWLSDAGFLPGSDLAKKSEVEARVADLIGLIRGGLPAGHKFVVSSPCLDKRSAFYKVFEKGGEVHEFACPSKSREVENEARNRARSELRRVGLQMDEAVFEDFLQKAGTDARQIANEVEKLVVYMSGRRDRVRAEDISLIVSPAREAALWDFQDAVGQKNLPLALKLAMQLMAQKTAPIALVGALENRIYDMMILRHAFDRKWVRCAHGQATWEVPDEFGTVLSRLGRRDPRKVHPFRTGKLVEQARQFSPHQLCLWFSETVLAHRRLVSGSVAESVVIEMLLFRLLGVRQGSGASSGGKGVPLRAGRVGPLQ